MTVNRERAISLGIVESAGGTFNGKEYSPYVCLRYALVGEDQRKAYIKIDDNEIKAQAYMYAGQWGDYFRISGTMDTKGRITINNITGDTDEPDPDGFIG